jgi:DNA-binding NarL/FixJ family response regulator
MHEHEENSGKAWTAEEERKLIRYAMTGCKISDIANNLKRSPSAIASRLESIAFTAQKFENARKILKDTYRLEDL